VLSFLYGMAVILTPPCSPDVSFARSLHLRVLLFIIQINSNMRSYKILTILALVASTISSALSVPIRPSQLLPPPSLGLLRTPTRPVAPPGHSLRRPDLQPTDTQFTPLTEPPAIVNPVPLPPVPPSHTVNPSLEVPPVPHPAVPVPSSRD
jgi:hypothetical protein